MLSKDVLRRISELNRQGGGTATARERLEQVRRQRQPQHATASTDTVAAVARNERGQRTPTASERPLSEGLQDSLAGHKSLGSGQRTTQQSTSELPEGRILETPYGPHFVIERPLYELWDGAERWLTKIARSERPSPPKSKKQAATHRDLAKMYEAIPDSVMFLDLETCGFSGSMVFLAGVLVAGPKGMTMLQMFARHYGEERAMMHTLWQVASQQTLLATFNGKSFDWPVVRDRTILHRLEMQGPLADEKAPHCDLLHMSRRQWKRDVPNCKLQTLEQYVCGRRRTGDIPGRDIPDAYHQFVRSGDAWEMRNVLHHNALDLVTLFQLSLVMLTTESATDPSTPTEQPRSE